MGFTAALLRRDAYAGEDPGPRGTCGHPEGLDVPRAGTGSTRVYILGLNLGTVLLINRDYQGAAKCAKSAVRESGSIPSPKGGCAESGCEYLA